MKYYWDTYYKKNYSLNKPTNFAKFCIRYLKKFSGTLYDIGCGDGRDTMFFLKKNINCYGLDKSQEVIKKNKKKLKKEIFFKKNFVKFEYNFSKEQVGIYSRFSLHSIKKKDEKLFFNHIKKKHNIKFLFIEVRTIFDELVGVGKKLSNNEFITNHYRRFLIPKDLKNIISKNFKIKYFKVSKNFARYKSENPKVLRIIAERKKKNK